MPLKVIWLDVYELQHSRNYRHRVLRRRRWPLLAAVVQAYYNEHWRAFNVVSLMTRLRESSALIVPLWQNWLVYPRAWIRASKQSRQYRGWQQKSPNDPRVH
jgi:hypothetical protein